MGNFNSCFSSIPHVATLVDPKGNIRKIQLPITAAEIMLDHPGQFISPADHIRRTSRIPAIKAEEELSAGKLYLLVPPSRINSKVSAPEMALIDSVCKRRRPSSKVSPAGTDGSGSEVDAPVVLTGQRGVVPKQWKPILEPIYEGI